MDRHISRRFTVLPDSAELGIGAASEPRPSGSNIVTRKEDITMIATNTSMLVMEAAVLRLKSAFMRLHEKECGRLAELLPVLRLAHPNVLLTGDAQETGGTFERMLPFLRTPIAVWTPFQSANIPSTPFRTLVIKGAERLNKAQQAQLLALAARATGDIQVVTMSAVPLLPLVSQGQFLDHLYYHLNVVLLEHA